MQFTTKSILTTFLKVKLTADIEELMQPMNNLCSDNCKVTKRRRGSTVEFIIKGDISRVMNTEQVIRKYIQELSVLDKTVALSQDVQDVYNEFRKLHGSRLPFKL